MFGIAGQSGVVDVGDPAGPGGLLYRLSQPGRESCVGARATIVPGISKGDRHVLNPDRITKVVVEGITNYGLPVTVVRVVVAGLFIGGLMSMIDGRDFHSDLTKGVSVPHERRGEGILLHGDRGRLSDGGGGAKYSLVRDVVMGDRQNPSRSQKSRGKRRPGGQPCGISCRHPDESGLGLLAKEVGNGALLDIVHSSEEEGGNQLESRQKSALGPPSGRKLQNSEQSGRVNLLLRGQHVEQRLCWLRVRWVRRSWHLGLALVKDAACHARELLLENKADHVPDQMCPVQLEYFLRQRVLFRTVSILYDVVLGELSFLKVIWNRQSWCGCKARPGTPRNRFLTRCLFYNLRFFQTVML